MELIKFKDNTYAWKIDETYTDIFTESKAKAYGIWILSFKKETIDEAIQTMQYLKNNASAVFSSNKGLVYIKILEE